MTTQDNAIEVALDLSSEYWKDVPLARVYIDNNLIFDAPVKEPTVVKWSGILDEGNHRLIVELYNKDVHQTVVENGKIIKDQILNIDNISFDEINIGFLKHTLSKYYPNTNTENPLTMCVNLGWNGRWELEFTTPVYIWLLENI